MRGTRRPAGLCAALAGAVLSAAVDAKDLGVRGATWPVAEPDLLSEIEARLAALEASGALDRFQEEAVARARARIEAPDRVPGIVPATKTRTRRFDPSVTVQADIRDDDGTLIAAAGTRIDPFAHTPLTRDLLFVDGTRPVEIGWALAQPRPSKIVLVAGRPLELMRRHGRPFFFDQGGRLTARLGIAATPSLVAREGARLRIEEIALEDGR